MTIHTPSRFERVCSSAGHTNEFVQKRSEGQPKNGSMAANNWLARFSAPLSTTLPNCIAVRYCQRFFDQVGHKTMYASSENKHFFTKSCHHQTYQNYEQPP